MAGRLPRGPRRGQALLGLAAAVGVAAIAAPAGATAGALLSGVAQLSASLFAAWGAVRAARRTSGQARAGWAFMALGPAQAGALLALLVLDFAVLPGQLPTEPLVASLATTALLTYLAGMVLLSPPTVRGATAARFGLDAMMASVAVFFVLWATLDYDRGAADTPPQTLLLFVFPAVDVAAATLAILVLDLTRGRVPGWYALLAAGAFVSLLAHTAAAATGQAFLSSGSLAAAGSYVVLLLMGAAGWAGGAWPPGAHQERFRTQWLPYVPFGLAILAGAFEGLEERELDGDLLALGILLVLLVLVRTLLLLVENDRLARRLVATDAVKTHLLRFISHEIANPLSPLKVQLHLLRQGRGGEEGWALVDRGVRRLESLSRDVRWMTLAERGQLVGQTAPTDLAPLVAEAVAAQGPVAEQRGVQLAHVPPAGPVVVPLDAERFDQVLDNLLSNALKFTPRGGRVDVRLAATPGGGAVLEVQDNGLGMDGGQLARLFTAFGRVHGHAQPGLGLGLYLCKAIVEGHGGRIAAASPGPGQGSTFRVELPPGTGAAPPAPRDAAAADATPAPAPQG